MAPRSRFKGLHGGAVLMTALFLTLPFAAGAQDAATPASPPAASVAPAAVNGGLPAPGAAAAPAPTTALAPAADPAAPRKSTLTADEPYKPLPRSAFKEDGALAAEGLAVESLMFTKDEIDKIIATLSRKAREARGVSAVLQPDAAGLLPGMPGYDVATAPDIPKPTYPPIPTKRTITLSGVVYRGAGDWIVWLNGYKLTPGNLLPEIVNISVERDRVALKWFDIGLGKVIALTLRPHQTYDITSGILLPGQGG